MTDKIDYILIKNFESAKNNSKKGKKPETGRRYLQYL